ncbi:protein kinase-like domain protein [Seiridium cupressi]
MELSVKAIQEVVHPTAAFVSYECTQSQPTTALPPASWDSSLLNPKNRIDSLDLPERPLWRIDGCSSLGMQYYAVPLFSDVPPLRIDVFIHESQPADLRQQLDLDIAFHTKDGARLSHLAITKYIIRVLGSWVTTEFETLEAFETFYRSAPFGTRLVLENLSTNVRTVEVKVALNHDLERKLISLSTLAGVWGSDFCLPQIVDFYNVQVIRVLHDSVCLVRIHGELFIFKALMSGSKYLYHELKTLCTLGSHPHVIARPIHLVQKACQFGAKKAIVGFTTFYHCNGSLRDVLPQLRIHDKLDQPQQLKWSIQLAEALEHLRYTSGTYYPDLRLDNIVLSAASDIVMVDFEQRGVWCEFAAPEVNSLEYVRLIATNEHADNRQGSDYPEEEKGDEEVHVRYLGILRRLVPEFDMLEDERYTNPPNGYNVPWIALSPAEQEAAEVYMLGRVLWCIFEGVSGPQKAAVWQSYPWESDLEFPEFRRTPPEMRSLIENCTRGRRQTLGNTIARQGSRLVLKGVPLAQQSAKDVQDAAHRFWKTELQVAEDFLAKRDELKAQGEWIDNHYGRPTLKEVLEALREYQKKGAC